jgi:hypothetical protein
MTGREQPLDLVARQMDHATGTGCRARSMAAVTTRKADASMARVIQRYQER